MCSIAREASLWLATQGRVSVKGSLSLEVCCRSFRHMGPWQGPHTAAKRNGKYSLALAVWSDLYVFPSHSMRVLYALSTRIEKHFYTRFVRMLTLSAHIVYASYTHFIRTLYAFFLYPFCIHSIHTISNLHIYAFHESPDSGTLYVFFESSFRAYGSPFSGII